MSTKENILELLEKNRGKSISGEGIAAKLSITRTAVWKAINSLKQDGHEIDAVPNKGYRLLNKSDVLSAYGILNHLNSKIDVSNIHVFNEVPSTNTIAKELAQSGAKSGTIVITERQTAGRGRMGRSFISPSGGIYLSMILRPRITVDKSIFYTVAACVGVCRAIEKISDKKPFIKWVNDIYIGGKKVCGILTEAATDLESGSIEYIILGIGLNFATKKSLIPYEMADIMTSVYLDDTPPITRNQMAANIIDSVNEAILINKSNEIIAEYRKKSFITGKKIVVLKGGDKRIATALNITDDARLRVQYEDGTLEELFSGEVSIIAK
ncbi:MAG: biotin--[acetyl-CoA-carboxylase] ligase [Eubacteriales bacterium]